MTRLRGSDADRRAWYEAHWRLRVDPVVAPDPLPAEPPDGLWECFGWIMFDVEKWEQAGRQADNREGPPTPTAMPQTVGWYAEQCHRPFWDEPTGDDLIELTFTVGGKEWMP